MIWPFADAARITQRFGDARARGAHRAWDIADDIGSPIVAPEDGTLYLFEARRSHTGRTGDPPYQSMAGQLASLLPRALRAYHWYWSDRFGCVAVLQSPERWWLFAHLEPSTFWYHPTPYAPWTYGEAHGRGVPPAWKAETHFAVRDVEEGYGLPCMGNSGISTGAHCHMEIAPPGYGGPATRIDPATLFPDR